MCVSNGCLYVCVCVCVCVSNSHSRCAEKVFLSVHVCIKWLFVCVCVCVYQTTVCVCVCVCVCMCVYQIATLCALKKACVGSIVSAQPCRNRTLAVHERVDSQFLVLAGSESTITEITEYKCFSQLKPSREFNYKSELNTEPQELIIESILFL